MGLKILYVENHPLFAKTVVTQFLVSHEVLVVPSIAEARQALQKKAYDLALVDFDLDDGKGAELVEQIHMEFPELRIIGVSAHAAGNEALLRAGANAICGKMEFDRIESVIRSVG